MMEGGKGAGRKSLKEESWRGIRIGMGRPPRPKPERKKEGNAPPPVLMSFMRERIIAIGAGARPLDVGQYIFRDEVDGTTRALPRGLFAARRIIQPPSIGHFFLLPPRA